MRSEDIIKNMARMTKRWKHELNMNVRIQRRNTQLLRDMEEKTRENGSRQCYGKYLNK